MKTRLTNAMRAETVRRLVDNYSRDRAAALRRREHALATKMLRQRYGADVHERAAALPPGWLPATKALTLEYEMRRLLPKVSRHVQTHRSHSWATWAEKQSVDLPDYTSLPYDAGHGTNWTRQHLGQKLYDELYGLCQALHDLEEERVATAVRLRAALNSYFNVEDFAAGWPEGYVFFPVDMLRAAPTGHPVPAPRVEDLNAALKSLSEAA